MFHSRGNNNKRSNIFINIALGLFIMINKHHINVIQTHNHLVRKRTLNHLAKQASLAKWLSVRLRTKWLWVQITLLSLKLQIWLLLRARSSLTFRQTIKCRFTLKPLHDMIITYSQTSYLLIKDSTVLVDDRNLEAIAIKNGLS